MNVCKMVGRLGGNEYLNLKKEVNCVTKNHDNIVSYWVCDTLFADAVDDGNLIIKSSQVKSMIGESSVYDFFKYTFANNYNHLFSFFHLRNWFGSKSKII